MNVLVDHIGKETPPDGKELVSTFDTSVKFTRVKLEPCTHEDADTRIMIHVADCVAQGYRKVTIRPVDTDVAVLAVSVVVPLDISLWIFPCIKGSPLVQGRHSGTGAHKIASNLVGCKAAALLLFQSLTGCDIVSSFTGR